MKNNKEKNQSLPVFNKKVQLSKGESIEHWFNFILLLIPVYFLGEALQQSVFPFANFPVLSILLGGLLLIQKLTSPDFKVYNLSINGSQFKSSNKAAALLYKWEIISNSENKFEAIKSSNWHWEGIKITVINKNGKLYLNSMVKPSVRANPITFGSNRRNIRLLLDQYLKALQGEDVVSLANNEAAKKEEAFWHESEFTLMNTFKRVIGYGLSLFFICLSIWMIVSGELQGLIYSAIILLLCGNYIYSDLKIIIEKKRRRQTGL